MNISELKKLVDKLYERTKDYNIDFTQVGIQVKRIGAIGGTPLVDIESIRAGFDWDANKIIIVPSTPLREIDRDEIKAIQEKYDELGWKQYDIDKLKRENKKLKKELELLKND